jgi:hypothetical protein
MRGKYHYVWPEAGIMHLPVRVEQRHFVSVRYGNDPMVSLP